MRFLLVLVLLIAAFLGAVWLGGESWLAGRATALIGQRDDVSADAVTPMRQMDRIGLHLDQVDLDLQVNDAAVEASLPWVEFWVPPTSPNSVHAALPEQVVLVVDGQTVQADLQGAEGMLRVSPLNEMAVTKAQMAANQVDLQGQPLLQGLSATAELVSLGHDAPLAARAAYDVGVDLASLQPAVLTDLGLPAMALPGALSVQGDLRLWLTDALNPDSLQGRAPAPQLVGFRTDGMMLRLGDLQARLVGLVSADEQGRAAGRLAVYTTDAKALLQALADTGMIPQSVVMLGNAMVGKLSDIPMERDDDTAAEANPIIGSARLNPIGFTFPDPADGEVRIPIFLQDGQVMVGPLPVGPALRLISG